MGFGLGAIASAIGSVASNVGNTVLGAYYNRKAASKSQDYAYSMTDYVNDYNTPVNQMLRLKEAGLNPNLVYASGLNNTSSGNSGASVSAYRPGFDNPILVGYQAESLKKQIANLDSQRRLSDAQEGLVNAQKNLAVDNALLVQDKSNQVNIENSIRNFQYDYAEAEHEAFLKSGKIPQSYYKNQNFIGSIQQSIDNLLQYASK